MAIRKEMIKNNNILEKGQRLTRTKTVSSFSRFLLLLLHPRLTRNGS